MEDKRFYIEYSFDANPEWQEILIAALMELPFESFLEEDDQLKAYISEEDDKPAEVNRMAEEYQIVFSRQRIAPENWNAAWEKSYDPVWINDQVYIRAHFHPSKPEVPYELLISPKMAFGTGHHATTTLMVRQMLDLDLKGKKVLDAGTGTGILAILAHKMNAKKIVANETDEWGIENAQENCSLNQAEVELIHGDIQQVSQSGFDLIMANINRNILMDEFPEYEHRLERGGYLLMSGIYEDDVILLVEKAASLGLAKVHQTDKDRWAAVLFAKNR